MYYTGIDVHPNRSVLQMLDEDGALGFHTRVPTTVAGFDKVLNQLDTPTRITFEASCCYWWLCEHLKNHPKVAHVNVVDPRRSRHIAEELSVRRGYGRAKNDRIDAEMLAEQDRLQLAPRIYIPTPAQMHPRTVNRQRFILVYDRTTVRNRLYGLLCLHGVVIQTAKFISNTDYRQRHLEKMPGYVRFIVDQHLAQIELLTRQIDACEHELNHLAPPSHPLMKLLMTAPGIGPVLARILITEILEIQRFTAPKYLISYAGLAPVESDSDGKQSGPIRLNRHCNYYLKYAFLQAAHNAWDHRHFRRKYELDLRKHSKSIAKLNLARRLAKSVYWMLIHQHPYHA
jgi:transposase